MRWEHSSAHLHSSRARWSEPAPRPCRCRPAAGNSWPCPRNLTRHASAVVLRCSDTMLLFTHLLDAILPGLEVALDPRQIEGLLPVVRVDCWASILQQTVGGDMSAHPAIMSVTHMPACRRLLGGWAHDVAKGIYSLKTSMHSPAGKGCYSTRTRAPPPAASCCLLCCRCCWCCCSGRQPGAWLPERWPPCLRACYCQDCLSNGCPSTSRCPCCCPSASRRRRRPLLLPSALHQRPQWQDPHRPTCQRQVPSS